jgi:hypothetical protein
MLSLYRTKCWATSYSGPWRQWELQSLLREDGWVTEHWLGTLHEVATTPAKAMKAMTAMKAMKAKK